MPGSVNQYYTYSPTPFGMFTKTTTLCVGSFSNPPKQNCVGGLIQDRVWNAEIGYRFGFQGQEKDDEMKGEGTGIEFMYRIYDSRSSRFMSVDPIGSKFPFWSPYAFSANRVIDAIEFKGLQIVLVSEQENPAMYKYSESLSDNSVEHVVGHGNSTLISNHSSDPKYAYLLYINRNDEFRAMLETSDVYHRFKNTEKLVIVIHVCNIGDGRLPNKWSDEFNATVFAADGFCRFDPSGESLGVFKGKLGGPGERQLGYWLEYQDGVLVAAYTGDWDPNSSDALQQRKNYEVSLRYLVNVHLDSYLNLRQDPNTSSTSLQKLKNGEVLTPTGNTADGGWAEVKTADGTTGWVKYEYLNPEYGDSVGDNDESKVKN